MRQQIAIQLWRQAQSAGSLGGQAGAEVSTTGGDMQESVCPGQFCSTHTQDPTGEQRQDNYK